MIERSVVAALDHPEISPGGAERTASRRVGQAVAAPAGAILAARSPPPGLPPEFVAATYRAKAGEALDGVSEAAVWEHYEAVGRAEGRICNAVHQRGQFLQLVRPTDAILEIGPFFTPAFGRPRYDVRYLDAFPTETLREKARALPGGLPDQVPDIDLVWQGQPYAELTERRFDAVFSSHAIEHQPCLVRHLQEVASILREDGRYFAVVPDKRYCFDSFFPETTIAEVLDAYLSQRREHSARTVMRGWLLTTHNDPKRHWAGDRPVDTRHQPVTPAYAARVRRAVDRWNSRTGYIDAHGWQFTPVNFAHLARLLQAAGLSGLELERVYPTVRDSFEFFVVLRRAVEAPAGAASQMTSGSDRL